jgi:DNA-binding beta-propeller fold protein YncE
VLVLEGKTNAITATVKAGAIPHGIVVDAVANQAYVINYRGDNATVIHGAASH